VVLDVGLPDMTGFDVCRALRQVSDVPVIFLTARVGEVDRVLGLELGADDYVVKPFSPRELVARVRACLRRRTPPALARWQAIGAFEIDREGRRIRYRGQLLDLTRYEYGVLEALLARPGAVLSRAQLMDRVWAEAPESSDRTVDTHIKTLRTKLRAVADGKGDDPIVTHRGLGYSLDGDG
jgi:two-component system catabolic regulation response regulator CreB